MFNFSYTQEKYDEVKEPLRYYLNWTNIKGNFKYKDCVQLQLLVWVMREKGL